MKHSIQGAKAGSHGEEKYEGLVQMSPVTPWLPVLNCWLKLKFQSWPWSGYDSTHHLNCTKNTIFELACLRNSSY